MEVPAIARLWVAATDRAINAARDSLPPDAVSRLKDAVGRELDDAALLLATIEEGSRPERIAAAGRLVDTYGHDAGDLGLIGAVTVRHAIQRCCGDMAIDPDTTSRLATAAHDYSLDLTARIESIARSFSLSIR